MADPVRRGDVFVGATDGCYVIVDVERGERGDHYKVRHANMTGHDLARGYERWYTPGINGRRLGYGERVSTPVGNGKVVGFDRSILRVLVLVPGVVGAHAVKAEEVTVVKDW
jgi:hypothetical protein